MALRRRCIAQDDHHRKRVGEKTRPGKATNVRTEANRTCASVRTAARAVSAQPKYKVISSLKSSLYRARASTETSVRTRKSALIEPSRPPAAANILGKITTSSGVMNAYARDHKFGFAASREAIIFLASTAFHRLHGRAEDANDSCASVLTLRLLAAAGFGQGSQCEGPDVDKHIFHGLGQ